MTLPDTGVKPIPVYVPPADGHPIDMTDVKWMKMRRSALRYLERRAAAKMEADFGSIVETRH